MPHSLSAAKRIRQDAVRHRTNKAARTAIKTYVKKVMTAVDKGDMDGAKKALQDAYQRIDKAAKLGAIHANKASRRKSQISKRVAAIGKK